MKILIVEDDIMLADLLEETLEFLGHEVCGIASDVAEGLRLVHQYRPDIMVLDMQLGSEAGSDVVDNLSPAERQGLGVLYVTGCADRVPRTLGHGILSKPYTMSALDASVTMVAALAAGELCGTPPFGFEFCCP